jgi:hypothetical protein
MNFRPQSQKGKNHGNSERDREQQRIHAFNMSQSGQKPRECYEYVTKLLRKCVESSLETLDESSKVLPENQLHTIAALLNGRFSFPQDIL